MAHESPPARAPSPLWRYVLPIGLVAMIGLLAALWPFLRALSHAMQSYADALALMLLLFIGALALGIVRAVWAWGWRLDARARQERVVRMQNDLPISVDDVHAAFLSHAGRSLDQFYAAKQAEAERATPLLTSQHVHIQTQHAPPQLAAAAESLATIAAVPTFAQLLDGGLIGPGRPLILGYNAETGQAITGAWKDLYSCGVGALQGAGKSWLLAFLLGQSAAAGGRLIICDLHAGDNESLANRIGSLAPAFMCDIASTPKEIESAFAFADDKLEKRKTNNARWPIVLVADEWTSLLRTSAGTALPFHIQNIAEQGRKFNVNGILAAQAWTKAASSDVRNQLTSHYVLRQRPDEARYQLGLRGEQLPADIRSLPDATGYLLNVQGELIKIVVPHMTASDIARCGEMIEAKAGSPAKFGFLAPTQRLPLPATEPSAAGNGTATGRQRDGSSDVPAAAVQTLKMTSPEAAHAASLYIGGKSIADIVEELRGVSSKTGGRAYRAARDEIEELIRQGVRI